MSRWSTGTWVVGAVVVDDCGDVYPISQLSAKTGLKLEGYYEHVYWIQPDYSKLEDLAGEIECKYEGSIEIRAHLRITDKNGGVKTLSAACEGFTFCGRDCYMLLVLTPGSNAASCEIDFQNCDEVELKEAFGATEYNDWVHGGNYGKKTFKQLSGPLV